MSLQLIQPVAKLPYYNVNKNDACARIFDPTSIVTPFRKQHVNRATPSISDQNVHA